MVLFLDTTYFDCLNKVLMDTVNVWDTTTMCFFFTAKEEGQWGKKKETMR